MRHSRLLAHALIVAVTCLAGSSSAHEVKGRPKPNGARDPSPNGRRNKSDRKRNKRDRW